MNKEEFMQMARDSDCGHESMTLDWIPPDGLERFASAILERAAVECENLKWVDGQPIPSNAEFARLVRSLKTKTQD